MLADTKTRLTLRLLGPLFGLTLATLSWAREPAYLMSHSDFLETEDAVFVGVLLTPRQYATRVERIPLTATGRLLLGAAREAAHEAGEFLVRTFESHYASDSEALRYIRETLTPAVRDGALLDGVSSVLILYRFDRGGAATRGRVVGTLKAAWPDDSGRLPLSHSLETPLEVPPSQVVSQTPWEVEREGEVRELKHLAVEASTTHDHAGLLVWFAGTMGLFGPREEVGWDSGNLRRTRSRPGRYLVHCPPRLLGYYRRLGFVPLEDVRSRDGLLLAAGPDSLSLSRMTARRLGGLPSAEDVAAGARHWRMRQVQWIQYVDLARARREPEVADVASLLAALSRGSVRVVTEDERCAQIVASMGLPPGAKRRFSPGFRGTLDP